MTDDATKMKQERDLALAEDAEPDVWRSQLEGIVDIYLDGTTKPYEDRAYCEGAFDSAMNDVQKMLAATSPQAAQPPTNKQALDLANEWHGQAGGELAPQLTSNEIAGMLAQFASDPTRDWPQWMKNQARVDTASFPTSPQAAQTATVGPYDLKCKDVIDYPPQAAQTEAALSEVVRLSEDAGLYGADFQTEAQEREAFEAEFDQLCKDYSIYGTMDARLCKVFFEAGRAGSKP